MSLLEMSSVFRIHIRPGGGATNPATAFSFCARKQVLGMGWAVSPPDSQSLTWEEYEALAIDEYGNAGLSRVRFLHDNVKPGDLIWTRDTLGRYYLGQVLSPWEYLDTPESRDADVVNVVRCDLYEIAIDEVPGKVVACFRASRTIQRIAEPTAVAYSRLLWNKVSNTNNYPTCAIPEGGLFNLLGSETVEDVVFIYLQMIGWLVVPHSRKIDTMGFEYVLINRHTGARATVQVKTGEAPLCPEDYKHSGQVFLFQANGRYVGDSSPNVECLSPDQILEFVADNLHLMPGVVQRWFAYLPFSSRAKTQHQRSGPDR